MYGNSKPGAADCRKHSALRKCFMCIRPRIAVSFYSMTSRNFLLIYGAIARRFIVCWSSVRHCVRCIARVMRNLPARNSGKRNSTIKSHNKRQKKTRLMARFFVCFISPIPAGAARELPGWVRRFCSQVSARFLLRFLQRPCRLPAIPASAGWQPRVRPPQPSVVVARLHCCAAVVLFRQGRECPECSRFRCPAGFAARWRRLVSLQARITPRAPARGGK